MFVRRLYEEQKNQIEQDMKPFGFLNDGLSDDSFVDSEEIDGQQQNTVTDLTCGNISHDRF